jgi:hypothetical protein
LGRRGPRGTAPNVARIALARLSPSRQKPDVALTRERHDT